MQITAFIMLRPLISILSLYWSSIISKQHEKLVTNLIITALLARIPFLLFPFTDNPWFIIASSTFYMMLSRGGLPSWIEIMKQNLPRQHRGKIFSFGSTLSYLEGVVLALALGSLLDRDPTSWKWLFPMTGAIGLVGVGFKAFIPERLAANPPTQMQIPSVKEFFIAPWKESWELVRKNGDFRQFQWGFMFAGAAVMLLQPALPLFFVDYLRITYLDLAIAFAICKGLGFAASSTLWSHFFEKSSIFQTSNRVTLFFGLYPLALIAAVIHPSMLYIAYFIYGIGQSGSHLVWHLSGATFSDRQDSSPFSNVNILTVGLRGAIAPPIGSAIAVMFGPIAVFSMSVVLCLVSRHIFFCNNEQPALANIKVE